MDLCGLMRVESINGKYILVIVDDYSRFTWVKLLESKDETPGFIIKFLKQVQVRLNATVRNIRTENRTEFVNLTLKSYYEDPSPSIVSRVPPIVAPIPADTTVIHQGVEEQIQGTENAQFDNDIFYNIFTPEPSSKESSSRDIIPSNLHQANQPYEHFSKWTKNHPLDNVIGMESSNPIDTLMVERTKLDEDPQGVPVDPTRYR
ncbi:retrovirus-related pol polyprotein from transposon TNT 1-94, partial [Tanacetum coccineum]